MGLKRAFWRSTVAGRIIDTVKNIVDEDSVVGGCKKTLKEDITEDNFIGKAIYDIGKYDGKQIGYEEASEEYEKKLLTQADKFLKEKIVYEEERTAYESLLDEYEQAIEELERKINRTEEENVLLQELMSRERRLRKLV